MGAVSRYELLERIGIGGMAEIYRARAIGRDAGSSSIVCVKKILPHLSEDPEYRTMFMDEARVAFTLHHQNIVQVLDLGRMDDQLFLALEYVDGCDLGEMMIQAREHERPLPVPVALHITLEVLKGLHYAHSRRGADGRAMAIVHRDVSPGNVLVSRTGAVKLGDFGIARAAVRAGRTIAGVVKGNALYMAPEQITGRTMDARTDVYGAGLLLLTLLCGRHPYDREPLPRLIDIGVAADVPDPSTFNAAVPREIDMIVARATELDPGVRYQTCMEFGMAIETWARGRGIVIDPKPLAEFLAPILPPGRVEEPLPPLVMGRAVTYVGPIEPLADGGDVPESVFKTYVGPMSLADGVPADERTRVSVAQLPAGAIAPIGGEITRAQAPPLPPPRVSRLKLAVPPPPALANRPSAGPLSRAIPEDPSVRSIDTSIVVGVHRQAIAAVGFAADGTALSTGLDQTVRVWDVAQTREIRSWRAHEGGVLALATLGADRRLAVTGSRDRTLRLWELSSGIMRRSFSGHDGWIFAVNAATDARRIVSGSQDRTVRVWDVERLEALAVLTGHRDTVVAVAIFPDGTHAVSGSYDRTVRLWNLDSATQVRVLDAGESVRAVALSPDATTALSGGADSCVTHWDLAAGMPLARFRAHREPVVAVAFSPDGRRALSGSYDGTACFWDLTRGSLICVLRGHTDPVTAVAFSDDGSRALSGSGDGTLRLWELPAR